MRRRSSHPVPDVFEAFAHRVEREDGEAARPAAATVARSAGITVGLMVLTSVAFVVGAGIASARRPELDYSNLLWEGVAITLWAVVWGALAAMAVLALGVVAVGLPWMRRRQREARSTSTSSP